MTDIFDLRFYGPLADAIDRQVQFAPETTVGDVAALRAALARRYACAQALLSADKSRCVIGDGFVGEDHLLSGGEVVEFFPPVSGG